MPQAKYTIAIPKQDNLKNPLTDIARAAHQYLYYGPHKIQGSYIEGGKRGNWRDDPDEPFDHLITFAEDHPSTDSAMKQLAHHVGEVANQWGVFVAKEGKGGPETWVVNNKNYRPGEPADPVALAHPELAQGVPIGPEAHPQPLSQTFTGNRQHPSGRKAETAEERKNRPRRCCF